jgi:hybrid cluster-associated redox disulfide protein
MKITKDMKLGEVIGKHPETIEVFMKKGLHCVGCHVASYESIEDGALSHGIDVNKLIDELNKIIVKNAVKKKKGGK